MMNAAAAVAKEVKDCRAFFAQSDEVTFLLKEGDNVLSEMWFGGRQNKIESLMAATMTAYFNQIHKSEKLALFDARAFQAPESDVSNVFLWRALDWKRNSLSMYCQANFSSKQLNGKNAGWQKKMLDEIGKSWDDDLTPQEKYGSWWSQENGLSFKVEPTYQSINHFLYGQPYEL